MENWIKISIGVVSAGLIAGGVYIATQIQKLKTGAFKVLGAKSLVIGGGKLSFTLITQFKNNSNISATVTNQDYDVLVNDKRVGTVKSQESVSIKAQDYNIIPLSINVGLTSLLTEGLANLGNYFSNKDAVNIKLKGNLTWRKGILSASQPFEINYTLTEIESLITKNKS